MFGSAEDRTCKNEDTSFLVVKLEEKNEVQLQVYVEFLKICFTGQAEGYLPFLTVSFVCLLQGTTPTLMLTLQLRHTSRVLLDELAGLAVVFSNQLLHLLVLLSLLSNKPFLLLQLLRCLSFHFWKSQVKIFSCY